MAQVAPIGLGNLPAPLTSGQAAQDGASLYAYNGSLYYIDSAGNSWALNAPRGDVLPGDQNLLEWVFDPAVATAGSAVTNGTVYLMRLNIRAPMKISTVWLHLNTAGTTPVANQNLVGLYNSSGVLLSGSGDASSAFSGSTGAISVNLSTPQNVGTGFYWVAMLGNFGAGTKAVFAAAPNTPANANVGLSAAALRFCVNGTGATSLAASFTPSSNTATGALAMWVGVS